MTVQPIVRVIDFETTGEKPPEAQVCEVGICDVHIHHRAIVSRVDWLCSVPTMPPTARAVHHIPLAACAGEPAFDPASLDQEEVMFVAAHNAEYEAQFIPPIRPMICTYKAALRVWPDAPGHSNSVLRYWLEDQGKIAPNHVHTLPAHRAGPDAYVTAHVLLALLDTGATLEEMVAWTKEPRVMPVCPIGKFRGQPWALVEDGFLGWMLRQPDMDADLKFNARRELDRRRDAWSKATAELAEGEANG